MHSLSLEGDMRRRQFITFFGGAVIFWPLAANAQQQEGMRRIGMLTGISGEDAQTKARITAFLQELQKLGWTEGRNVRMEGARFECLLGCYS
jgi:putative tryptophan/tyrosine transport system substrate-binding protein